MLLSEDGPNLILIIDDSTDAIRLLGGILSDLGKVIFATNGPAGIALAREQRPQLVLLDVEMHGMDGYEVCRALKSDPNIPDCSVMFVTARSTMESEIAALEAGAVDFVMKPLNAPIVRARVRTHLKLQRASEALARLANRDGLTGLYNRRYFDEHVEQEFLRHRRQGLPLALAFVDIDYFKRYNDHYGHQAGDDCLRKVAHAIARGLQRPGETIARYGGEEFVVILPYTNVVDAERYGTLLCKEIGALGLAHAESDAADHVTISVGLTSRVPGPGGDIRSMLLAADKALYQAKGAGRNCARYLSALDVADASLHE